MKKVRIINYPIFRRYEGMIGNVTEESGNIWKVVLEDGTDIMPYAPYDIRAQCELVLEPEIINNYSIY